LNFIAHAVVAGGSEPYAFGAMVPDLSKLAGGAPLGIEHEDVDAGVRSHHAVDAAFHDHARFKAWMRVVRDELGGTRIAYAAAHVGVELAMDGVLLERGLTDAFDGAMRWARTELDGPWRALAQRAPEVVDAYRTPDGVARRTLGAISRRPRLGRLALDERELSRAIAVVRPDIESELDDLLRSLG
jgi:hypothetical protein